MKNHRIWYNPRLSQKEREEAYRRHEEIEEQRRNAPLPTREPTREVLHWHWRSKGEEKQKRGFEKWKAERWKRLLFGGKATRDEEE